MKRFLLLSLLLLSFSGYAGTNWQLKKEQHGIKVYTAATPGSNVRSVKVECMINATPSQLTALLLDAKAHEQWVYSTKTSYLVKKLAPGHLIYYSETSLPWPLQNRDVVVDLTISQQPITKVITVRAKALAEHVAAKKNTVRVLKSEVQWTVTPVSRNSMKIEYVAQADPGGAVPAWVVNMFSTKGPLETFIQLRKTVLLPAYSNASFDFIAD